MRMPGGADLAASARTLLSSAETVKALPPRRRKTVKTTASAPFGADGHGAVFVGHNDPAQVPHVDRLAVLLGDDAVLQFLGIGGQRVGEHLELPRLADRRRFPGERSIRPTAFMRCSLPSRSATSTKREARRDHAFRLDLDDDLADVAALDRDVGNVEDVADAGPQIVEGVVVQGRRIAPAGNGKGNDGEDRRRLPLDDPARAGGEFRGLLGHLGPHVVEGLDHVGARPKSTRTSAAPRTELGSGPVARPAPR